MKHVVVLIFSLLSLILAACGTVVGPSQAGTPIAQVDLNDEFWYGSLSSRGVSLPAGMGFIQTGNQVTGILAISDQYGSVIASPRMTGTVSGYDLSISDTDAVGDIGMVQGSFSPSQQFFNGTLTFIIDGEASSYDLSLSYESQLGVQMQAQSVTSFKELVELLE